MNNKIRTLLVDDEPLAIKLLSAKLKKLDSIEIIGECKNGREAISAVAELSPDLIFLDIQMPGMSGLDVIKRLQSDTMPLVVFATAYEQYALDAFDANAVDYVLKPIDDERVHRAVDRALQRLAMQTANLELDESSASQNNKMGLISALRSIQKNAAQHKLDEQQNEKQFSKIVVKDRDEINILEQEDIEWVDAAGDYVCIHSKGQTHIKRSTLKEILEELDDRIFKRVHRSTIVNMNCIKKVLPHTKGEFFLLLGEYDKVKVSRNYKEVIKDFLAS